MLFSSNLLILNVLRKCNLGKYKRYWQLLAIYAANPDLSVGTYEGTNLLP
jgi:hypothetical protein